MQKMVTIPVNEIPDFKRKIIRYSGNFPLAVVLDSNSDALPKNNNSYSHYDLIAAFSTCVDNGSIIWDFNDLSTLNENNPNWYFGYITYDVKNSIEELTSSNKDALGWPPILFFIPEILILLKNDIITLYAFHTETDLNEIIASLSCCIAKVTNQPNLQLKAEMKPEDYLFKLSNIKKDISHGNVYELNFCQEFYDTLEIDPYDTFNSINQHSPSPFAAFVKYTDLFLLSASPERFLMKNDSLLISQPIKGTISRGESQIEDEVLKAQLKNSLKEQAENIMIVDLVRNDLSRIALKNTVHVEELCGIYTYPHVHQMISTISAFLPHVPFLDIIRATFPMGSMTGAPKLNAMKLIEKYETVKRGLYSGTVGYIAPDMNFDFNVVIRSLQYNSTSNYVSYIAGGAITAMSDPQKEYEECLLKIYAISSPEKKISYAQ